MTAKTSASNASASTAQAFITLDWNAPTWNTLNWADVASTTPNWDADGLTMAKDRAIRASVAPHPVIIKYSPPVHKNRLEHKSGWKSKSLEELVSHIGGQPVPLFDGEGFDERCLTKR